MDAVTNLSDGVVEEAKQQPLRRRRRRAWFGAIAAVLAVAMVAGYFLMPGSSPLSTNAYAISEAEYPETAQYPNENDYFGANGEFDSDAYSARLRRLVGGHARETRRLRLRQRAGGLFHI